MTNTRFFFPLCSLRLKFLEEKDYLWDWILLLSWWMRCRLCFLCTLSFPQKRRRGSQKTNHWQPCVVWDTSFTKAGTFVPSPSLDGCPNLARPIELSTERSLGRLTWMPHEDQEAVLKKVPSSTEFYSGPTGWQASFTWFLGCFDL